MCAVCCTASTAAPSVAATALVAAAVLVASVALVAIAALVATAALVAACVVGRVAPDLAVRLPAYATPMPTPIFSRGPSLFFFSGVFWPQADEQKGFELTSQRHSIVEFVDEAVQSYSLVKV